jgi:DNA-binding protein H-NS
MAYAMTDQKVRIETLQRKIQEEKNARDAALKMLEDEMHLLQKASKEAEINNMKMLVALYSIVPSDIFTFAQLNPNGAESTMAASDTGAKKEKKPVEIKFRDPQTGDTWTKRGITPRWVIKRISEGRKLEEFAVN